MVSKVSELLALDESQITIEWLEQEDPGVRELLRINNISEQEYVAASKKSFVDIKKICENTDAMQKLDEAFFEKLKQKTERPENDSAECVNLDV